MARPFDLSIVIVHYRTPELVAPCVTALRRDLAAGALDAELLLVDNGSDPQDRRDFADLDVKVLDPGANTGYAGGTNRGFGAATADRLVVMNPDVRVRPGCLKALVSALDEGYSAAGPGFHWDEGGTLLLPPGEPRNRLWEIRASLAQGDPSWAGTARRAWRAHARRHWTAEETLPSYDLSGALLALRRDAWEEVGPFDEGYALYFEETDWLHRLRRAAGRTAGPAAYVPRAEAVHLYDQSARREPRAEGWFGQSRRRFQEKHYGAGFARLLEALECRGGGKARAAAATDSQDEPPALELDLGLGADEALWVEVSPRAGGFPAAAQRIAAGTDGSAWSLPQDVWERLGPGTYWLRVVDGKGRELATKAFTREAL